MMTPDVEQSGFEKVYFRVLGRLRESGLQPVDAAAAATAMMQVFYGVAMPAMMHPDIAAGFLSRAELRERGERP